MPYSSGIQKKIFLQLQMHNLLEEVGDLEMDRDYLLGLQKKFAMSVT